MMVSRLSAECTRSRASRWVESAGGAVTRIGLWTPAAWRWEGVRAEFDSGWVGGRMGLGAYFLLQR